MTTPHRRWRRAAAALAAGTTIALVPAVAHAVTINLDYDATGTAHIARTNSSINLGPSTLTTALNFDNGNFTGSLPLPGTTTRFEVIGFIPVTADVNFVEAAPLVGNITLSQLDARVTSTASYHIKLSNIKIAGFPTFTGAYCRTKNPVSIPANTPTGETFDILGGGTLAGQFTIGDFQNCGLNTGLINLLIPGPGNTANIEVTNGRVVP